MGQLRSLAKRSPPRWFVTWNAVAKQPSCSDPVGWWQTRMMACARPTATCRCVQTPDLLCLGTKMKVPMDFAKMLPQAHAWANTYCLSWRPPNEKDGGWRLCSADIKSAFMKGDKYVEGLREIYLENVAAASDSPKLPLPDGCIARILKGVFGFSDAPRQWYLRLNRALLQRIWQRNPMDHACWFWWKRTNLVSFMESSSAMLMICCLVVTQWQNRVCLTMEKNLDLVVLKKVNFNTAARESSKMCRQAPSPFLWKSTTPIFIPSKSSPSARRMCIVLWMLASWSSCELFWVLCNGW